MKSHERTHPLEALGTMLAMGAPFGDSDYIHAQMQSAYRRRLRTISTSLPEAGELVDILEQTDQNRVTRTYGDTVLRCAIQHAMRQLATGVPYGLPLAECADIFRKAHDHLNSGNPGGPLESGPPSLDRLGMSEHLGSVWSDDGSDRLFPRSFRNLVQSNFGDPAGSPNQAGLEALRRGVQLLEDVLPSVTESALSHAHMIALFPSTGEWTNRASCSQYRLVGTVFLRRGSIDDPWWVAEHLLHESLHQKLYDIRHGHSILIRDSTSAVPESTAGNNQNVVSIWNMNEQSSSNRWGVSRSLVAFHVYAHLALFGLIADERASELEVVYGPRSPSLTDSRAALERALYLGKAIKESCWQELGPAGECFVDWLTQFLDLLAPALPSNVVLLDLSVERYKREAQKVDSLNLTTELDGVAARKATEELQAITVDELATMRQILGDFEGVENLTELTTEWVESANVSPIQEFSEMRAHIAKAISLSTLDERDSANFSVCRLNDDALEVTTRMIERSSERLGVLFSQVEAATASSTLSPDDNIEGPTPRRDERAELLNLTDLLGQGYGTEEFCLFLYTIVRMHAPKNIVELGTGYGASAFWMALAAKRNGMGHVWTVDDQEDFGFVRTLLTANAPGLKDSRWDGLETIRSEELLREVAKLMHLDDELTFVRKRMNLDLRGHFDDYPFAKEPIDLLFSDFRHGPKAILQILGEFLPRMSTCCSVFIDSASTSWPSYLLLESLVDQLNSGHIPTLLQEQSSVDLAPLMRNRRVVLVHLTEWRQRAQNSTAWLKFEPIDLQPYPRTVVRGLA